VYPPFVQLQTRLAQFLEQEQLKKEVAEAAKSGLGVVAQPQQRRR